MGRIAPAAAALATASGIRSQAQHQAGALWRDIVLQRMTARNLQPLDVEERRFHAALAELDGAITAVLNTLG